MSLLILSFDSSSDRIGTNLYKLLNTSSKPPHLVSFCSFNQLFHSSSNDYETIFFDSLKIDSLSRNDLLGFLILIDIATTNKLHLQYLPSIQNLLSYLNTNHPFQSILVFIHHASSINQLYTSPLTGYNLNLLFLYLYPFVHGIIFNNIDEIVNYQQYHAVLAQQIARIFLSMSELREFSSQRTIQNTSIEFIEFIQQLLTNPEKKILIMKNENFKKYRSLSSYANLFIQRGQYGNQEILILNNDTLTKHLLEQLIIQPVERKLQMNRAYFHWLNKKFNIDNLENLLANGISLCKNILFDQ